MSPRYADLSLPVELVHGTEDDTAGLDIHSVAAAEILPDANLTAREGVGTCPTTRVKVRAPSPLMNDAIEQ